jgi:hypothetical protein
MAEFERITVNPEVTGGRTVDLVQHAAIKRMKDPRLWDLSLSFPAGKMGRI